ncbi:MAG: FecR domain-containing protein [Spirochaetales bacterium]|nr:FecR domain-containing protein [Spirochaetales bacterium]
MRNENNTDLKHIIEVADSPVAVSRRAEEKIFSRMAEMTAGKSERIKPVTFFRYSPALTLILLCVIVLPLCLWTGFAVFVPGTVSAYPITLISDSGIIGETGQMRSEGDVLEENDRIVVPETSVCDLEIKGTAGFRFFPGSEARLVSYSQFSRRITIRLEKGSMYVNKTGSFGTDRRLSVSSDQYLFSMTGTRVLFEKTGDDIIAVCFEGEVRVFMKEETADRHLVSLGAGQKIRLAVSGGTPVFNVALPSNHEIRIDEENRDMVYANRTVSSLKEAVRDNAETDTAAGKPVFEEEGVDEKKTDIEITLPSREQKKPLVYNMVNEAAKLPVDAPGPGKVLFFSVCFDGTSVYILSTNNLFRLGEGGIEEPIRFQSPPLFRVKPVLRGNTMMLADSLFLYLIDTKKETITSSIPLGDNGVMEDNYHPLVSETTLYLPIKNRGYYTLNLLEPDEPLKLLRSEHFPLSPIVGERVIVIGAFYENYIAALDRTARELWKVELAGKSFCNPVWMNNRIYVYLLEGSVPKIIEITDNGRRNGEWTLEAPIISDFYSYGGFLFGFYTDGGIFVLDPDRSRLSRSEKIFSGTLSTRTWRNYYPLIAGKFLYTGTDSGSLIVWDCDAHEKAYTVIVRENESFYTAPLMVHDDLYIISNRGIVYRITKS